MVDFLCPGYGQWSLNTSPSSCFISERWKHKHKVVKTHSPVSYFISASLCSFTSTWTSVTSIYNATIQVVLESLPGFKRLRRLHLSLSSSLCSSSFSHVLICFHLFLLCSSSPSSFTPAACFYYKAGNIFPLLSFMLLFPQQLKPAAISIWTDLSLKHKSVCFYTETPSALMVDKMDELSLAGVHVHHQPKMSQHYHFPRRSGPVVNL